MFFYFYGLFPPQDIWLNFFTTDYLTTSESWIIKRKCQSDGEKVPIRWGESASLSAGNYHLVGMKTPVFPGGFNCFYYRLLNYFRKLNYMINYMVTICLIIIPSYCFKVTFLLSSKFLSSENRKRSKIRKCYSSWCWCSVFLMKTSVLT